MRKLVTVRKVDSVKEVGDHQVLVIDGAEVAEYHSPRDLFHAGEYCVFVKDGVALPAKAGRPWTRPRGPNGSRSTRPARSPRSSRK